LVAGAPDNVTIAACEIIDDDEQLNSGIEPIVVGALEMSAPIPIEVKKSKKKLLPTIAAAILLLIAGFFVSNSWLNSQWYVGVDEGNVAIFQGIDQQIGPFSFSRLNVRSELPSNTLSSNDVSAIENGISIDNVNAGLLLIQEMWSRSAICESAVAGCTP
jgi:hypothetical protein